MNYWNECISQAFNEAGIVATEEQIRDVAEVVEGGHDNYGMAYGHDVAPSGGNAEADRLRDKLKRLRAEYDARDERCCKEAAYRLGNVDHWELFVDGNGVARRRSS